MNPIRNILVIVDPTSEEQPAVAKAELLAKQLGAQLELFACDTKASQMARRAMHARRHPTDPFITDLRPLLEGLALPLRARGFAVNTVTKEVVDSLHVALLDRAQKAMADLVLKDTHHHSIAKRTFLSNTDWQLIRYCPVPLLLVKPKPWASKPCILAAVDPGHVNDKPATLDRRILDHASLISQRLGGELHVGHAYLPEAVIAQALGGEPPMIEVLASETLQLEEQRQRAAVISLLESFKVSPDNLHVKIGSPIEVLVQLADILPADVMVMGAIARSGLGRAFIGSTAEDVLERLPCDALVIKTPDFSESLPF